MYLEIWKADCHHNHVAGHDKCRSASYAEYDENDRTTDVPQVQGTARASGWWRRILNPIHILLAWKLWWIKIPGGTPPSCARKSNHLSFRARWKAKVILRCQKDELLSIFFFVSGSVQRSMRWNQIWHRYLGIPLLVTQKVKWPT